MGNWESVVGGKKSITTPTLEKDLESTFFPEVHCRLGDHQTRFVCDANEKRQNLPQNDSAQACVGITSGSGYGPPLT